MRLSTLGIGLALGLFCWLAIVGLVHVITVVVP